MIASPLVAAVPAATASAILLPVTDHLPLLGGFVAVVLGLLVADLTLFHRNPKPVGWLAAAGGVAFWVVLALLFNAGLFVFIDGWLRAHPQPLLNAGLLTADDMASQGPVALAASNALSTAWLANTTSARAPCSCAWTGAGTAGCGASRGRTRPPRCRARRFARPAAGGA